MNASTTNRITWIEFETLAQDALDAFDPDFVALTCNGTAVTSPSARVWSPNPLSKAWIECYPVQDEDGWLVKVDRFDVEFPTRSTALVGRLPDKKAAFDAAQVLTRLVQAHRPR